MNDYYCHKCALTLSPFSSIVEVDKQNLTGSSYQLSKFIKHTTPMSLFGRISVFNQPEYKNYRGYSVSASVSGSVEIDSRERMNIIWYAGRNVGVTYNNGCFECDADTIKVVLSHDENKIHTFPVSSIIYDSKKCKMCGKEII